MAKLVGYVNGTNLSNYERFFFVLKSCTFWITYQKHEHEAEYMKLLLLSVAMETWQPHSLSIPGQFDYILTAFTCLCNLLNRSLLVVDVLILIFVQLRLTPTSNTRLVFKLNIWLNSFFYRNLTAP